MPHLFIASGQQSRTSTGTGGIVYDFSDGPISDISFQVSEVGGAATSWDVALEGSLDGVKYHTEMISHTKAGDGDGGLVSLSVRPMKFLRINVVGLVLGAATSITVTFLGME